MEVGWRLNGGWMEVGWRLDGGWMEVDGNGKSLDKENSEEINAELLEQVLLK